MPDASVTHAAIFGAAALKVGSKMARAESGVNAEAVNPVANERQKESPCTTKFSAEQTLSFKVLPEDLLVVLGLRHHTFTAAQVGFIPGCKPKIPHTMRRSQQKSSTNIRKSSWRTGS